MSRVYQVPTHARGLTTLAIIAVSLPQLWRGPLWQAGLLVLVLVWRAAAVRQRLPFPGRWLRFALLVLTVAATWYSFGRVYGPEAGTALVTSLFALKYLELPGKRDAYVLIVLGYFVCATALLFYRGPGAALYIVGCMVLLTACLAGINYGDTQARSRQHLKVAAVMVAQALPLALVLFVLVPRIAPLWDLNLGGQRAQTGMSGSMSPGQVSDLAQSSAIAFRVQFNGPPPPQRARYWRGLTYGDFDGTTWRPVSAYRWHGAALARSGNAGQPGWYRALQQARTRQGDKSYRYRVILEPTHQRWLYALAVPFSDTGGVRLARDMRLVADQAVEGVFSYQVESVPAARQAMPLDAVRRRLMLQLPLDANPRAHRLAQQWRARYANDADLIQAALRYFRSNPFYYTLQPPLLAGDTVDAFLFDTRRGFCENYASSFTFLMRAAGIPARVVAGYQGGEMNTGGYMQVRQSDAHAWSEVWLDGAGWITVDPTAAVAPERIEQGLDAALAQQGEGGRAAAFNRLGRLPVLFRVRQWVDYANFSWQKWVLGYRRDQQQALLQKLLGTVTPLRMGLALLLAVSLCFGLLAAVVLLRRRPERPDPLQREFHRLHDALVRRGMAPAPEASAARLEQLVVRRWPDSRGAAARWRNLFEQLAYRQDDAPEATSLARLQRARRALLQRLLR